MPKSKLRKNHAEKAKSRVLAKKRRATELKKAREKAFREWLAKNNPRLTRKEVNSEEE